MGAIRPITLILRCLNTPHPPARQVKGAGKKRKPNQGVRRPRLSRYGPATHNRANNCRRIAISFGVRNRQ
jgi:hypothetical protein